MATWCFIQARLSSQRLPGKVLLPLAGKPLLQHVVDRARLIPGVDDVIVITHWPDWMALQFALHGVTVEAWQDIDQDDVLSRYVRAAEQHQASYVLRITGDCPVLNPAVAGRVLQACIERQCYATNDTSVSGYPDGWDAQAWPIDVLLREHLEATDPLDREHPGRWADRQPTRRLVMAPYVPGPEYPKLSVDTLEDLERVREWIAHEHATRTGA